MADFKRCTDTFRHFRAFGRLLLWKRVKSQNIASYRHIRVDIDISIDNNGVDGACVSILRHLLSASSNMIVKLVFCFMQAITSSAPSARGFYAPYPASLFLCKKRRVFTLPCVTASLSTCDIPSIRRGSVRYETAVPLLQHHLNKAVQVFAPTMPSAPSPFAFWNAITAAFVFEPKSPSAVPQL